MQKKMQPKSQFRTLVGLTFKQGYARIGGAVVLAILFIAVFGPFFAPYTFDEFVDAPNAPRYRTQMHCGHGHAPPRHLPELRFCCRLRRWALCRNWQPRGA